MKQNRLRLAAAALLGLALSGGVASAEPPETVGASASLSERLDGVLDSAPLKRARVSALVVRERDGGVLYERTPERALTPASNVKVLTAIAALSTFGPTHQFETRLLAPAALDAEGGIEELVVVGGGDPVMNSEDWWMVADALRRAGLRRVRGDIVLDDSAFDLERWHPAWGQTSSRAYHAPISALTANYGTFSVTVRPGPRAGTPVEVAVDPPVAHLTRRVTAQTVAVTPRGGLRVDRELGLDGTEVVVVAGGLRSDAAETTFYRSVLDPTRYAGSVLRMQLEAVGIRVDGGFRVARGAARASVADALEPRVEGGSGDRPDGRVSNSRVSGEALHEILVHKGRPVSQIVRLFMKYSNNMIGESLVKAMGRAFDGRAGSWASGLPALITQLERLGIDTSELSLFDGSGLAYTNKVAPRTLVEALRLARRSFDFGPEFVAALPLAGRDGTLEKRAEAAADRVRAKTGLLTRVTALSGLARLPNGEACVFSILVNGYRSSDGEAMDAVDRFVGELVASAAPTLAVRD